MAKITEKKFTTVKKSQKIAMGIGDLGYCLISSAFSTFFLFFGNVVMGIPGTLVGIAIACGTLWEAVAEPVLGYFTDNNKDRFFGRRHGFIILGIFFMAAANIFVWSIPQAWGIVSKFIYLIVGIILLESCHTLYATPSNALSIDISDDYNERSSIQSYKSVFYIAGMLLPALLLGYLQRPTDAFPDGRFNPQSYLNLAYLGSACVLIFGLFMILGTYSHVPRLIGNAQRNADEDKPPSGIKAIYKAFFTSIKNKNFRSIVLGYSISMMASTFLITLGFHTLTFTFKTTSTQMYLLIFLLFAMTILGQPLWLWISIKTEKKKALMVGLSTTLVGSGLLFLMFLFRAKINAILASNGFALIFMALPLMVCGLGIGVLFSLPLALVGDTVIMSKAETNKEKAGTYAGFMTLAYKGSQAIGQLIIGGLLDAIGFREGSYAQSPGVESALGWMFCIGVAVSIIGGILAFSKFSLKKEDVNAVMEKIQDA